MSFNSAIANPDWIDKEPYEQDGNYYAVGTSEWVQSVDLAKRNAIETATNKLLLAFGDLQVEVNMDSNLLIESDGDGEIIDESIKHRSNTRIFSRIQKREVIETYTHKRTLESQNKLYKISVLIQVDKRDIASNKFIEDEKSLLKAIELGYEERKELRQQIEREAYLKVQEKDEEINRLKGEKNRNQLIINRLEKERKELQEDSTEKDEEIKAFNRDLEKTKLKNKSLQESINKVEKERDSELLELKNEINRLESLVPRIIANTPVDIPGFSKIFGGVGLVGSTLTKGSSNPNRDEDDQASFAGQGISLLYRFFFVPDIDLSAQFTYAAITRYEDNYLFNRELPASGNVQQFDFSIHYNWGNSPDSWLGKWWTLYIGMGLGVGRVDANLNGENYSFNSNGLSISMGFDYRFENNFLIGIHASDVRGSEKYNQEPMNTDHSTAIFGVGYLY